MDFNQKTFLILTIVGGALVLLSYYIGIKAGKNPDLLWGGTPVSIRGVYTISIFISAVAFIVTTIFLFLNMRNTGFMLPYNLGMHTFNILYTVLLICSMLWMPLVGLMISSPSTLTWIAIRIVLILVGLAALGILILLLGISPRPSGGLYWSSVIGMTLFFIHTGILDALLWPYFWNK
jgi:hypothetical protein